MQIGNRKVIFTAISISTKFFHEKAVFCGFVSKIDFIKTWNEAAEMAISSASASHCFENSLVYFYFLVVWNSLHWNIRVPDKFKQLNNLILDDIHNNQKTAGCLEIFFAIPVIKIIIHSTNDWKLFSIVFSNKKYIFLHHEWTT